MYFDDTYTYPYNDRFYNNRAVVNYTETYGGVEPAPLLEMGLAWNNSIYTLGGKLPEVQFWPNNTIVSWSYWQSLGQDGNSTVSDYPSYEEFYGWIQDLLSF